MSNLYKCHVCGREFEMASNRNNHQQTCGMTGLDSFDGSGELRRLDGMNKALRKNDYDKNDTRTGDGQQRTLRNKPVRSKPEKKHER